jgi:hypothetical protein
MEVVLANGSLVNANSTHNRDLWWALKGGSSNFGIVTRFDVATFSLTSVYGGTAVYNSSYLDAFVNATAYYVSPGGGSDDVNAAFDPSVQWNASTGALKLLGRAVHVGLDPQPAAYANYTAIPTYSTDMSIRPDYASILAGTEGEAYGARTHRQLFWSTALKATPESVFLLNETFFEAIAEIPELRNVSGLTITTTSQVITKAWIDAARSAGGDAIDLQSDTGIIGQ